MQLVLFGATGNIGARILDEALQRGHRVVAIARNPATLATRDGLSVVAGDISNPESYATTLQGADAVIVSVSPRGSTSGADLQTLAHDLLARLPQVGVRRLFWVGGAGSLEVAPGVRAVDTPDFPPAYKDEALALAAVLELLRASSADVDWTYLSPSFEIAPGQRTGHYRLGGDQPLFDADGRSHIGMEDFAVALLDRVERDDAPRKRVTVGY